MAARKRRLVRAGVLLGLVVPFVFAIASWVGSCIGETNCADPQYDEAFVTGLKIVLAVAGGGLVALLAVGSLLRILGAVGAVRPSAYAIAFCVAAGLLAAAPISAGWSDGCNSHGGRVALIEAPRVWFGEPDHVHASYLDIQTLMACIDERATDSG